MKNMHNLYIHIHFILIAFKLNLYLLSEHECSILINCFILHIHKRTVHKYYSNLNVTLYKYSIFDFTGYTHVTFNFRYNNIYRAL